MPNTNLQNLDVAAVEASLDDEAAVATRPHGQVDFGLVGTGLHRKPRERRVSSGAAACVFNHAPKILAVLFGQVRHHDALDVVLGVMLVFLVTRTMAQIFISYASGDRERAKALAEVLSGRGWTVFWDRTVPPGRVFDEVIAEALQAAKCVVVMWSRASVDSRWVKEEADDGAQRRILIPALIDEVPLPLGFRRLQAARLVGWPVSHDAHEFDQLVESIRRCLAEEAPRSQQRAVDPPSARQVAGAATASSHPRTVPVGKGVAILMPFLFIGLGVGIWSEMYNSDVGFIAGVPFWIVGSLISGWVWWRGA